MIKHIVMIRLKNFLDSEKKAHLIELKKQLDALPALISVIKAYETGINFSDSSNAYDFVLLSTFDSVEKLKEYSIHPEHKRVLAYINEISDERKVVDYLRS